MSQTMQRQFGLVRASTTLRTHPWPNRGTYTCAMSSPSLALVGWTGTSPLCALATFELSPPAGSDHDADWRVSTCVCSDWTPVHHICHTTYSAQTAASVISTSPRIPSTDHRTLRLAAGCARPRRAFGSGIGTGGSAMVTSPAYSGSAGAGASKS